MKLSPRIGTAGLGILVLQVLLACSPEEEAKSGPPRSVGTVPGANGTAGSAAASGNCPTCPAGAAGTPGLAGTSGTSGLAGRPAAPPPAGSPGVGMPGIAGSPAIPPAGPAGAPALAGRSGGTAGAPTMGVAGMPAAAAGTGAVEGDMFAAERQACVEHINMYRATLNLAPLKRATPEQELCSDNGAKTDGDTGKAHGSAGSCKGLGGQNTCPGYPVRAGSTLTATLKGCLDQMWAEGEPPQGVQPCIQDRTGCFLMHGHWINMSMANYGTVACGFYKMANGRYWMNQNFGR